MRFPLGRISISLLALSTLAATGTHLYALLLRHGAGDSGEAEPSDHDIASGETVFSCYPLAGERILLCIITSPDRSATTVVMCGEEV